MGEDGKFTHMNSFSRNEIDGVIFVVTVSKFFFFTVTPLHTQEHLISVLIKQIKIYSFEKHRRRHCKKNTINTLD